DLGEALRLDRRRQRYFEQRAAFRDIPKDGAILALERGPQLFGDVEPRVLAAISQSVPGHRVPGAGLLPALMSARLIAEPSVSAAAATMASPTRADPSPLRRAASSSRETTLPATVGVAPGSSTAAPLPSMMPTGSVGRSRSWTRSIASSSSGP